MSDVVTFFLFVAGIVFAGFLGTIFFKKTRFSDFILLMVLGVLIGPVLNWVSGDTIAFFREVTPFFASLALVILMFEGGLQLNLQRVLRELSRTTVFTLLVFFLSVALIGLVLVLFGWDPLFAILAACILGGTGSAIIVPLVNNSSALAPTKTLLTLESAITDALCVIAAIAVGEIILAGSVNIQPAIQSLLAAFSIAAVLGIIAGIVWLRLLRDFDSTRQYQYVLTLGVLFLLFAVTEFAKGNGAFSALIFGMVLGNAREFGSILGMRPVELSSAITDFQTEISLFVRTFFFVYLGVIFDLNSLALQLVLVAVLVTAAAFLARFFGAKIFVRWNPQFKPDEKAIAWLMARGLAAAVLATYPATLGIANGNAVQVVQITFLVILFSNLATTFGLFLFEKNKKDLSPQKKAPKEPEETDEGMEEVKVLA